MNGLVRLRSRQAVIVFAALLTTLLAFAAFPARAFEVQQVTSPGGIRAWLVEDHSMPIISMAFGFRAGSALDPPGKEGLARFAAGLIDEGAGDLDSAAFQARVNEIAMDYEFDAGIDDFSGSIRTLTEHRDEAFALLSLALTEPRFDAGPVERIRGQLLAILADDASDPGSIADRVWWHATFPEHPYGRQTSGTAAGIRAITVADLRTFVSTRFGRDGLVVGVVGDIAANELAPLLDRTFGALPASSAPASIADATPAAPGAIFVVDRNVPQSVVLFGQAAVKRHDPDFYAAYVMNHILGGGSFSSWLTQEVREARGLAYSIGTGLVALDHAGLLQGSLGTKNASVGEAIDLVEQQWRRMRDEGPTEKELADAKLYLTGSYSLRFSSTRRIAESLVGVQLEGFASDYFDERNGYIEAVTLEDVRRVAKRILDPEKLTFVIVGQPEGVAATQPTPKDLF